MLGNLSSRLFLITAVVAVLLHGCSGSEPPKGRTGAEALKEAQAIKISTATIEGRTVERTVEATGTLTGWDEVVIASEASGKVMEIKKDLGDRVAKGDVMAVLDQREASLGLDQARAAHRTSLRVLEREKATLDEARTIHKRYEELFKREMVSASQYEDMRTRLDVAEAEFHRAGSGVDEAASRLALAGKRLDDAVIRSPIDGFVSRRSVTTGAYIAEKAEAFTAVSTGTLKFRGTVPEAAVPDVRAGQEALITVEAFRGRVFKGRLTRMSPSVDVRTRTLEVEASVPNADGALKPGFFARGVILTDRDDGVAFAPEAAVYSFVGINKVFVIEGGVARERIITVGSKDAQMVEIDGAGVKPGQVVATSNLSDLFEGAKITVRD